MEVIRKYLEKRRNKQRKLSKLHEEQYKSMLMEDYGVTRNIPNQNGLICPVCDIYADENNICPKCKRKL